MIVYRPVVSYALHRATKLNSVPETWPVATGADDRLLAATAALTAVIFYIYSAAA